MTKLKLTDCQSRLAMCRVAAELIADITTDDRVRRLSLLVLEASTEPVKAAALVDNVPVPIDRLNLALSALANLDERIVTYVESDKGWKA